MVEDCIDIGREHTLVVVVNLYGWVGPPQECLWQRGAVAQTALYLKIRTTRAQRESRHSLLVEHTLHLVYPHRNGAVGILLNLCVDGHIGAGAVVLWPVELDATTNPRTSKTYKGGLYHMVVIYKVALLYLIVCHLHTPTQFGQNHHLDIFVLDINSLIVVVYTLITN